MWQLDFLLATGFDLFGLPDMTLDRGIYCQMWQSKQYTITVRDLKNLLESD